MKTLSLILLLAASLFGQTIQDRVNKFENAKEYQVRYDKFDKVTTIDVDTRVKTTRGPDLSMHVYLSISDDGKDNFCGFIFYADKRVLFNQPQLSLLLDGKLLEFESDKIDYYPSFMVKPDHLVRIANSKTVELQLVISEGELDAKTLSSLRNLVSLLKSE